MALLAVFFGLATAGRTCDDTLMILLTSSDPKSEFSQGIRRFNQDLTALGTALKDPLHQGPFDSLLGRLLESWLALSNRFSFTPPEEARGDPNWIAKMQGTADRLGRIRAAIKAGQRQEAHDQVLELSVHLGTFFESVKMSESYRIFLRVADQFYRLEQQALRRSVADMPATIASITEFLRDLRPRLATDTLAPYARTLESLDAVSQALSTDTGSGTLDLLVQKARDQFLTLRSHLLMMEWFPSTKP
ncbi:MAG: hypothetical protein OZSIB_4341 [Candidatus Ozemobacter sibiricus]|uniref:Uncharacterized protein n=1 Tax=Candidatus Ozemobacter sibiricus TaxID=2268124 RepID=A0A367ZNZ6_9BACT|nr:MAG: hypothetical protein OZSIB_4341 [Candidatus Ozemobacter sibiricus]